VVLWDTVLVLPQQQQIESIIYWRVAAGMHMTDCKKRVQIACTDGHAVQLQAACDLGIAHICSYRHY
jgi:hypothetical protein